MRHLPAIPLCLRGRGAVITGLLLVAATLFAYLLFGEKPWSQELDFSREAKERVRTRSFVVEGLWWGSLINLILALVAAGLVRFYPKRSAEDSAAEALPLAEGPRPWRCLTSWEKRTILFGLAVFVAVSTFFNLPMLDHSLWGDEEATARRFIVGHVHRQDDDSFKLVRPLWQKTLWNFDNGGNNHVLYSVLGRLSHEIGPKPEGPDTLYFSERWLRLPSFLAGIASLGTLAWLAIVLGRPRAALLAPILLSLHPFHVLWGHAARGYPFVIALAPAVIASLVLALRRPGRWGWWLAFAAGQFLLFYAHLGTIYFLIPLNAAALLLAWRPWESGRRNPLPLTAPWQWLASSSLAGALTIQLMAPCFHPFKLWLAKPSADGDIGASWLVDWFGYTFSGMPWTPWDETNPYSLDLASRLQDRPWLMGAILLVPVVAFLAGIVCVLRSRGQWPLLLPLLLPGPLTVIHAKLGGNLLYPWYMVGFLPAILLLVVFGLFTDEKTARLESMPSSAPETGGRETKRPAIPRFTWIAWIALGFTAVYLWGEPRRLHRLHPVEPLRASVAATREILDPFDPRIDEVITVTPLYHHASRLYDPAHLMVRDREAFLETLRLADREQKPLFVNIANLGLAEATLPEIMGMIENTAYFEPPEVFHGQVIPPTTRYVFRYRPGSLKRETVNRIHEQEANRRR